MRAFSGRHTTAHKDQVQDEVHVEALDFRLYRPVLCTVALAAHVSCDQSSDVTTGVIVSHFALVTRVWQRAEYTGPSPNTQHFRRFALTLDVVVHARNIEIDHGASSKKRAVAANGSCAARSTSRS